MEAHGPRQAPLRATARRSWNVTARGLMPDAISASRLALRAAVAASWMFEVFPLFAISAWYSHPLHQTMGRSDYGQIDRSVRRSLCREAPDSTQGAAHKVQKGARIWQVERNSGRLTLG